MELDTNLVGESLVEAAKHGSTTGQIDTVAHDIGIEPGGVCSRALSTAASIFEIDFSMQWLISW